MKNLHGAIVTITYYCTVQGVKEWSNCKSLILNYQSLKFLKVLGCTFLTSCNVLIDRKILPDFSIKNKLIIVAAN